MNKINLYIVLFFSFFIFFSCSSEKKSQKLKTGFWRGEINVQNHQVPFIFEVFKDGDSFKIKLHDSDNMIAINEVTVKNDSVIFPMHIFDATIKAKINGNSLSGVYTKNYVDDYILPFKATFGKNERLDKMTSNKTFDGKWSINFLENDGTTNQTIGLFKTKKNKLKGTILTKTGDYRFLEGTTDDNKFTLYAFDGNHAFVFKATFENDTLKGDFWSGKSYHQKFIGYKNENASLPNPNKLTYLKEGYDKIEFSFPNLDGKLITLNNPKYKNKVVILQVFGTWCPNCMDETKFYSKWYDKNKNRGVEIIGLAYEAKDDFEYAKARVQKVIKNYNVQYDYLIAGTSNKDAASKSLPMLNHIMSFPTSIIIDKKGKVRSIHTGFSGPATGDYYIKHVKEFNELMDTLLNE